MRTAPHKAPSMDDVIAPAGARRCWVIQDLQPTTNSGARPAWFDRTMRGGPAGQVLIRYANPVYADELAADYYGWGVGSRVVQRQVNREDIVLAVWPRKEKVS